MREYVILTDSACDIAPEILEEWGVGYKNLTFKFTDADTEYTNEQMPAEAFYAEMRKGRSAKTAAVNVDSFVELFEAPLSAGKDVLYLGFSSGLSNTYNAGRLAAESLREKYPEAKILTVDTLAASAGEGLMVYLTVEQKKAGATVEEAAAFCEALVANTSIWFTVDDLVYLKRGGRISPTTAFVGNALGIKPILHMDEAGHLVNVSKVRGRRASLLEMAKKYDELATDKKGVVFISHGDCLADAEFLANTLREKHGADVKIITDVGPVIGAHSGPGTLALFFVGAHK